MRIFSYILLGVPILIVAIDIAAIDGSMARTLSLPGAGFVPFAPLAALGVYVLAALLAHTASKRRIAVCWILAGFLLGGTCASYPKWLFERYSHKIEISSFSRGDTITMFLQDATVKSFEREFNTPTVQYSIGGSSYLVVPSKKYTPSMLRFLKDRSRNHGDT